MGMTLRTYDEKISNYRKDFAMKVDTRFDLELGKLAYELRTTKASIYREAVKNFMREKGIEVKEDWL